MGIKTAVIPAVRLASACAILAIVGGCVTTSDCDPSRTNIFSAAACEGTGTAQVREDQKTAETKAVEARRDALKGEVERLRAEADVRRSERLSLSQRLSGLDRDMIRLGNLISRARSVESVNQAKLVKLRAALTQLQTARSTQANPTERQVATMEQDAEVMFQEMDALLSVPG